METNTVLVQYIGKQPTKVDNVRKSGRIWNRPGVAIEVPSAEALWYTAYPDCWRIISASEYEAQQELNTVSLDEFKVTIAGLPLATLREMREVLAVEILAKESIVEVVTIDPTAGGALPRLTAQMAMESNDPATQAAYTVRIDKIASAIRNMDLREDEFAVKGWPRASAIRDEIGGEMPNDEEISSAMFSLGLDGNPPTPGLPVAPTTAAVDPETIQDPADLVMRERAQIALGEADTADRDVLWEMATAFEIEASSSMGLPKLRKTVIAGLREKIGLTAVAG